MKTSINCFLSVLILALLFTSCDKQELVTKSEIKGFVQKGPFLNGTAIEIYELDENYNQTGKSFSTQIFNNSGEFSFNNLSLVSPYILIKATGFYFNEITGENSVAPISLYSFADVTDISTVNVNVLTHIEKSRVEYLIRNEDLSFTEARQQAKLELLDIFSMQNSSVSNFESLNISSSGNDNAILLAISVIMQGYRTESEFSNILGDFITDFSQDGEIDDQNIGTLLINDARLLKQGIIRQNLEDRYESLEMNVTIPDFEEYLSIFISQTSFTYNNDIVYPQFLNYNKENLLYNYDQESMSIYTYDHFYSLAANLPKGTSIKVTIEPRDIATQPNTDFLMSMLMPSAPVNFNISNQPSSPLKSFASIISDTHCEVLISFYWERAGEYILKVYENDSEIPKATKTLIVTQTK